MDVNIYMCIYVCIYVCNYLCTYVCNYAVICGSLSVRHGTARPQVADGGTASSMEVSCEYIELAVADG